MKQNRFIKWSKIKYTKNQRLISMIPLGIFFLIIMPAIFIRISNIDKRLDIPRITFQPFSLIISIFLIILGLIFAFWAIQAEFIEGKGTPVPMMPTQKLVITGPFVYCRNPMGFGTICAYLGVVILIGSLSSFILLVFLSSAFLIYIKIVEEKELEIRFGKDYLEYKERVPFIIPRISV